MGPRYEYRKCAKCGEVRAASAYPKTPTPEVPRDRCRTCVNKHGFPDAIPKEATELHPDVVLFREEWAMYRARQPKRVPEVRQKWNFRHFWVGGKLR